MWSTQFPHAIHIVEPGFGRSLANSDFLRRYAKRLLRAAHSERSSEALPVLRRIVAMQVTPEISVAELHPLRRSLQLKHVLHTLAREVGFASWELCVRQVDARPSALLDRYRMELGMFRDFETNWFPDMAAAQGWQREHGGYLIAYGTQAVAILAH
ncbi:MULTISPECIES: hypothetical protein [unclassified Herbaspirillum]|uniref:hypothetical protein n=1 Tax=unclassified Herbaspirillum TaxID=2624150 RepID=UPI00115311BC|nr:MULTISPECIES: hypothetical protein [unclassified Herbaspirillum]MBB5391647.1 hypothetical protein [Herbaspirillum sp. SJZ102]TQK12672.1 hypothetical protein FB599_0078 [Herbaspirillum sp. SJZ130]TQK14676.1 hypothetical protein FB598_0016 [Herbaspirillum sp. SJZ106]